MLKKLLLLTITCLLISPCSVLAYDEPAINLGFTSFFDGAPPAGPGFYFEDYLQYYHADRLNDNSGNELPFPKTGVTTVPNLFQLLYLAKPKVLGAHLGFDVLVPVLIHAHIEDGLQNNILKAQNGMGDVLFGPIIQFDPINGCDGKPRFSNRIEIDVIAPTGRYNPNYVLNPSSHFWSFNPYWAGTVWLTPKWTASTRLHYLWNAKNTDPNLVLFGPEARSTQAGQAFFANFATEYEVVKKLYVGVNGYYLNQFTDTKVNDHNVSGRRERVWALGPGALYSFSKDHNLFFNVYFERDARNRPQGASGIIRYVYHFGS